MAGRSPDAVYDFEWDRAKAPRNARKHHIRPGCQGLLDALAVTVYNAAHSPDEERWYTLGLAANGRLLAVAYTYEVSGPGHFRIRIISAREASRRERRWYEDEPHR